MSIARLRALTHDSCISHIQRNFKSRNEYRPIEGIDTTNGFFLSTHVALRRNEYRPIKGIDTLPLLQSVYATDRT